MSEPESRAAPDEALPGDEVLRLRADLVLAPLAGHADSAVLKDALAGKYFRFRGAGLQVLRLLEAGRTRTGLVEELGEGFPQAALHAFLADLDAKLLLERGLAPDELRRRLRERWKTPFNPFWSRVRLVDPDRFLGRAAAALRPLFHPVAVAIWGVLLLIGGVLYAALPSVRALPSADAFAPADLVVYWLTFAGLVTLHELAHGLACKHFGGEVREMGFLLLFFSPCFYTNISDTYLFERRSHRLWVAFAGAYVELAAWAVAVLALALLPEPGALTPVLRSVLLFAGLRTVVLNLNPLIRLDGYYLLVELLELPNLRPRAFAYLGGLLRPGRARLDPRGLSRRERRIYLLYALAALLYVLALLGLGGARLAAYLVERFGPLGGLPVVVSAAFILVSLWRQLFGRAKLTV